MKNIKRSIIFAGVAIAAALITGLSSYKEAEAATPRIMVSDYSLSKEEIYAGDSFTLEYTLQNTAQTEVRNIKTTVFSDDGSIIPDMNAGTSYIEKLAAKPKADSDEKKNEAVVPVALKALGSLSEKAYKVNIKIEYEDWNGSYSVTDSIYIDIHLSSELKITGIYLADEEIRIGNNFEVVATVSNTGGTVLYNVEAKVSGPNMANASYYIGTIEPGKSKNVDIITKATALYDPAKNDNKIYVTYENKAGEEFEVKNDIVQDLEKGFGIIPVIEKDISGLVEVKSDTSNQKLKDEIKTALIILAVIAVIAAIVFLRRRRQKRIEEMFD